MTEHTISGEAAKICVHSRALSNGGVAGAHRIRPPSLGAASLKSLCGGQRGSQGWRGEECWGALRLGIPGLAVEARCSLREAGDTVQYTRARWQTLCRYPSRQEQNAATGRSCVKFHGESAGDLRHSAQDGFANCLGLRHRAARLLAALGPPTPASDYQAMPSLANSSSLRFTRRRGIPCGKVHLRWTTARSTRDYGEESGRITPSPREFLCSDWLGTAASCTLLLQRPLGPRALEEPFQFHEKLQHTTVCSLQNFTQIPHHTCGTAFIEAREDAENAHFPTFRPSLVFCPSCPVGGPVGPTTHPAATGPCCGGAAMRDARGPSHTILLYGICMDTQRSVVYLLR